jgi:hypothetical protein
LPLNIDTWVEMNDSEKQSSLLLYGMNYGRKKFYSIILFSLKGNFLSKLQKGRKHWRRKKVNDHTICIK